MPQKNNAPRIISLVFLAILWYETAAYVAMPSFTGKSTRVSLARLSAVHDEKPLFSVPIPGSRTATLQVTEPILFLNLKDLVSRFREIEVIIFKASFESI